MTAVRRTAPAARTTRYTWATAPGALPLAGHLLPWLRDPHAFLRGLPAHGDLVAIRLGPVRALVVCHPDLVHRMLVDDRTFDKGGAFFDRGREFAGNGLVTCPYRDHRRQRRLLQPAFHRSRLPGYAALMTDQIDRTTAAWRDGETLDVGAATHELTSRIAGATMFAVTAERAEHRELVDTMREVLGGMYRRMLTPAPFDRLPTPAKTRYDRANARLRDYAHRYIRDYRQAGVDHGDLLSLLLHAEDGERPLDQDEIYDQVVNMLVASVETMGSLLATTLRTLARHPEVEQRLHAECDRVLAGRPATFDDLPQLPYTRQVVEETLRRYSPAWLLSRRPPADAELGGHPVPAGTNLFYSPYQVHGRAELYPDPDRYDPDRWAGQRESRPPTGEFLPFGEGARKCIGDGFAMTEAVLALASIAARWRLRPVLGRRDAWTKGATLAPRGLRMTVHAR
ncbi:cytochrome P450 [Kitasatospora sp. NPDC049285]|uniref:cytochrome P450 n=1 Tax=Kitasatospora sp. NPDC049285 TaxID=3157096 RepID=UPI003446ED6F